MPSKPKRPCRMNGCGRLCENGEQYCAQHKPAATKQYNQYQRDPATNKRYGRAWKRIRDRYIKVHPLCEQCSKEGKLTPAEEVHHILPLSKGGGNEAGNLMALCKPCHSRITAESGDRWHDRQKEF